MYFINVCIIVLNFHYFLTTCLKGDANMALKSKAVQTLAVSKAMMVSISSLVRR